MPDHPGFDLKRIDDRSLVRLRVRPAGADAGAAAMQLPQAQRWRGVDPVVCWLGPDQWLLTSDTQSPTDVISLVDSALSGQLYAATDLSSSNVCYALKGFAARTVLAMGCGVDLHESAFTEGQCVRTNFANVPLFIVCIAGDHFDLYVDRSHARYLNDWLTNSGEDPITRDPKYSF